MQRIVGREVNARGDRVETDDGSTVVDFGYDALGRLVDYDGSVAYAYDGLDRVAERGADAFEYPGLSLDASTDGDHTYSYLPGGTLLATDDGTDAAIVGGNRHGDLTWLLDPAGETVSATRFYDAFGSVVDETGSHDPSAGFQGDFTDPASGLVWMGARWYDPTTAGFVARDSVFGELQTPITLNRYTYANGNPLVFADPDGRFASIVGAVGRAVSCAAGSRASQKAHQPPGWSCMSQKQKVEYVKKNDPTIKNMKLTPKNSPWSVARNVAKNTIAAPVNAIRYSYRGWEDALDADPIDIVKELGSKESRAVAWEGAKGTAELVKSVARPVYDPAGWTYDTLTQMEQAYNDAGGGWTGIRDAANQLNPATQFLNAGDAYVTAIQEEDYRRAARAAPTAAAATVSLAFTGYGGLQVAKGRLPAQSAAAADDVGLSTRGLRPSPGTRVRPEGIPESWRISGTDTKGGVRYYDPSNKGNAVRVMQGNPKSPYPNSQVPYVRWQLNGKPLDVAGNKLPTARDAAAHIPLEDFTFMPELFE